MLDIPELKEQALNQATQKLNVEVRKKSLQAEAYVEKISSA